MANTTTFLKHPAQQRLGYHAQYAEQEVDFSLENVVATDTLDVIKLPKGAIVHSFGMYVKTTQATVELAAALATAGTTLRSAAVIPAANVSEAAAVTTGAITTAEDTIRVTVSVADATTAKVVFFVVFSVSDAGRN